MRLSALPSRRLGAAVVTGAMLATAAMVPTPASAAPTRYEAEAATLSQAAVASNHTGFSGTGFVDYTNIAGGFIEWTVNATAAGTATLGIRYANGTTANRPMTITVNGTTVDAGSAFGGTGNWDTWATATLSAPLQAGSNTVRATADGAAGGPNVDWLSVDIGGGGPNPRPTTMAAPYYYNGWGDPPNIRTVMNATGVKQFTMAFMLAAGRCEPKWDSGRNLTGGVDQQTINAVRAAGGDVEISFGGWSGDKLGPRCTSVSALAGAYQRVIDAYNLKYIDIDIENTDEFGNNAVMDRILNALKMIKQNNPGITTIITFGTGQNGPEGQGIRLIQRAAALQVNVDVFTIMPFDFGCRGNMATCTKKAADGLRDRLKSQFGWTDAQAYSHMGISGMNGVSDDSETTTVAQWEDIRNWANQRHLARLAFWSVNRDRPCPGQLAENCSGISQPSWQFTRITAGFTG